jgi:hypothetical protein
VSGKEEGKRQERGGKRGGKIAEKSESNPRAFPKSLNTVFSVDENTLEKVGSGEWESGGVG